MLSEISQLEKDKYYMIHSYVEFKKQTNEQRRKETTQKQTLKYREQTDGNHRGGG